jgi:hypothetical protein
MINQHHLASRLRKYSFHRYCFTVWCIITHGENFTFAVRHVAICYSVRFGVLTVVIVNSAILLNLTPYRLVEVYRRCGGTHCLNLREANGRECALATCMAYSSVLNMKAVCSSETSLNCQTSRRHIPNDSILQSQSQSCNVIFHFTHTDKVH